MNGKSIREEQSPSSTGGSGKLQAPIEVLLSLELALAQSKSPAHMRSVSSSSSLSPSLGGARMAYEVESLDDGDDLASAITISDEETMSNLMAELSEGLLNLASDRESTATSMVVPISQQQPARPSPFMAIQDSYLAPNKTIEQRIANLPSNRAAAAQAAQSQSKPVPFQSMETSPQPLPTVPFHSMEPSPQPLPTVPPQNRTASPQVSLAQSVYHTRAPREGYTRECIVPPVTPDPAWQVARSAYRIDIKDEPKKPVMRNQVATAQQRRLRTMLGEDTTEHDSEPEIACDVFKAWYATMWIKLVTRLFGRDDLRLVPHLESLAGLYLHRRLFHQAEQLHLRALRLRKSHYHCLHESCASNFQGLARINRTTGKYPEAMRLFQQAIDLRIRQVRKTVFMSEVCEREVNPLPIVEVLGAFDESAQTMSEAGRYEESLKEFQRALKLWNNMPLVSSEAVLSTLRTLLLNYQYLLVRMNKYNEAAAIEARRRFLYDDWRRERS